MKKIYSILYMFFCILAFNACDEEDQLSGVNFPPTVLSVTPGDKSNVPVGGFDVRLFLVDGKGSPLANGSLILRDSAGNALFSVSKELSGTRDSIIVEGSTFDASNLVAGNYTLHLEATDVNSLTTSQVIAFKIVNSLYVSVESQMFIAGEFNGWGADELTLVADNTWEIQNVNLSGGKWKLKNTPDWTDTDWGDPGCDGVMEVTSGGGPDTDCGYTGSMTIRFNDATLAYTIISAGGGFEQNVEDLYILGTFNDFEGDDYRLSLVDNNTWEIEEIRLKPGDKFKFAEGPNSQPKIFGDVEFDGQAEEFGSNIVIPDTWEDAFYKITFNDVTLMYAIEFVRFPYPDNLYLVGGSTSIDWNAGSAIPFVKREDGKFEIYTYLTVADGFKFLETQDWPGDWGKDPDNDGNVIQEGESNVTISSDGFYRITVNFIDGTYEVLPITWGLLGSARTGSDADGWNDPDSDMALVGDEGSYTWTIDIHLLPGAFKFRANDGWDINLGDDGSDGSLEYGASTNISISTEGDYTIELILDPTGDYYTYTVTQN